MAIVAILGIVGYLTPYKVPTRSFTDHDHPLYTWIPRHRSQIEWYDIGHWTLWALLGNDDDGLFGEKRSSAPPSLVRAWQWAQRNPLHNFTFYVIGSADRPNSKVTIFESPSLFVGLHGGKPFISSKIKWANQRQSLFYIGWRERGNFGIKCVFWTTRKELP